MKGKLKNLVHHCSTVFYTIVAFIDSNQRICNYHGRRPGQLETALFRFQAQYNITFQVFGPNGSKIHNEQRTDWTTCEWSEKLKQE
jgi:hypothetical protein